MPHNTGLSHAVKDASGHIASVGSSSGYNNIFNKADGNLVISADGALTDQ